MNWTRRTAAELADALAAGETTSVELTQAHLDRIAAVDGPVHAFLHVDTEGALEQAAAADERRSAGNPASPLDGVPIAVSDRRSEAGRAFHLLASLYLADRSPKPVEHRGERRRRWFGRRGDS